MATQRVSLAKIGGAAAAHIAQRFQLWSQARQGDDFPAQVQVDVDAFAETLREHSAKLPILYFSEWIDMWSMGDLLPELGARLPGGGNTKACTVSGRRYEACCHAPPIRFQTATIDGEPPQESMWLKPRLEEAQNAWAEVVTDWVIVILREPLGGSVADSEVAESLESVPSWLTSTAPNENR
jgi:hypothetical protein